MESTTIEPPEGRAVVDASRADLGRRAMRGGVVTLTAQAAKVVIQFVSITALSRLLEPADFGLFAMAAAVVGLVELFKDFGLSLATVQRPTITFEQINALFWVNTAAGVALSLVVAGVAPLLAWASGEPRLLALTMSVALALALGGLTVQHVALLRRKLRFGLLAAIDVGSQTTGVIAAIGVAILGGGCWALAAQLIVTTAASLAIVAITSDWRPSLRFSWRDAKPLLSFGADMAGCNVLSYLCKTLDNVLIGFWWGPAPLGIYTRAYAILLLPITQINAPIAAVALPVLSRLRHEPEAFEAAFLKFVRFLLALTTPACFAIFVFAPEVVRVLLGDGWTMAAPVLRQLSVASLALPIWYVSGWLFVSTGQTRAYLRLWLFVTTTLLIAFLIGLPSGIIGVARAYAIAVWALAPVIVWKATRGGEVRLARVLGVAAEPAVACLLATLPVLAIDSLLADRVGALPRLVAGSLILAISGIVPLGLRLIGDRPGKSVAEPALTASSVL